MNKHLLYASAVLSLAGCAQAKPSASGPASTATAQAITLTTNGRSAYTIALAADAIPAEKNAAEQLQRYLREVTGATLPVKPEAQVPATAPQILVGPGRRAKALLPQQNWASLGADGVIIRSAGRNLVLAGGRPRGSLYAVFQFLEDAVGCRWWTPEASTIPRKRTLRVPAQKLNFVSPFRYREHYTTSINDDPVFATIMRENGHHQDQTAEWGGHYSILGFVHTFSQLLPPETYFRDHPEWYSDPHNGGKPCTTASRMPEGQNTQLCLSNPEVLEALTSQALQWIEKEPEAGYISISQNDDDIYCRCPECTRLFEQEGSEAGPILNFVNKVAERINRKYPGFRVETLAYRGSETPPRTVRPAKNVLIRLAPIFADFGHPLESDWNKRARDNVRQWAKIAPDLFVWNYVTNFNSTLMPHPNWQGLGADLRFFAAHNVTGIFEQGNDYTNMVGDFAPLRAWVTGKLMWNPALDQAGLASEFLKGYYGAAAPFLKQYIDLVQSAFLKTNSSLSLSNRDFKFLGLAELNRATRLFDQAAAAVKENQALEARLQRERISVDLAWLMRYRVLREEAAKSGVHFLGPEDGAVALDEFFAKAKGMGVRFWGERVAIETQRGILEGRLAPAAPLPAFLQKFRAEDVIDIQDRAFSLHGENLARFEDDMPASDGKAASSIGSSPAWAIQAELNQGLSNPEPEKWHVYAAVRLAFKPGAAPGGGAANGAGISAGVYDDTNMKHIANQAFPLEQFAGEGYHFIDLGALPLTKYGYVWFASSENQAIERLYVDRVILVREPGP